MKDGAALKRKQEEEEVAEDLAPGPARPEDDARGTNKATLRILSVLSCFASSNTAFGVTELGKRLHMTKNMVFRALTTLVDQGYLIRSGSGNGYELSYRVVELCNPKEKIPDLRALCAPFMAQMHELTGETVVLGLHVGHHVVLIDGIEADTSVVSRVSIGGMFPLHVGVLARTVLAFMDDPAVKDYVDRHVPLKKVTDRTISDPASLWEEVRLVRGHGYALGYGDASPGRMSVAFPLFDSEGKVWGAVGVRGPDQRFTKEKLDACWTELLAIAEGANERTRLYQYEPPPVFD